MYSNLVVRLHTSSYAFMSKKLHFIFHFSLYFHFALFFRGGIWKWSNGNEFHPDKEFTEIISNDDKKKSTESENTTFCLTVGDKNHLEIENCENSLRYLCGDFQGKAKDRESKNSKFLDGSLHNTK